MYLYGASGHAKVVIDTIMSSTNLTVEAIYDDFCEEDSLLNIPIKKDTSNVPKDAPIIISIGDNQIRRKITEKLKADYKTIIHKSAIISKIKTKIGEGTVVTSNVTINVASEVGKHCIINTASVIEHDCFIEDFVHISPNVTLSGNVSIGEGTHVGSGAVVIQGVKIGKWCVIGAGSTVIKDIPDYSVAVGCPAKIIRRNELRF